VRIHRRINIKPFAIIPNSELNITCCPVKLHYEMLAAAMLERILQSFLQDPE